MATGTITAKDGNGNNVLIPTETNTTAGTNTPHSVPEVAGAAVTTANPMPVGTPVATGAAASGALTIATAGTYQVLFAAGTMKNGAFIQVPATASVGLYVDIAGATGSTLAGTSQLISSGGEWVSPVAFTNAVTVRATAVISFQAGVY